MNTDILGIRNRTENWKTANAFSPLFGGNSRGLAQCLTEHPIPSTETIRLELFWSGIRDYLYGAEGPRNIQTDRMIAFYNSLFSDLRSDVDAFGKLQTPADKNYRISEERWEKELISNLRGTEIDVVLESSDHLFIGEMKHESRLGGNGDLILVHQLIRQYVMARILVELTRSGKDVIPFVVADDPDQMKKTAQVKFMVKKGWMKERNVLKWQDIA